jgi:hypothetical protein
MGYIAREINAESKAAIAYILGTKNGRYATMEKLIRYTRLRGLRHILRRRYIKRRAWCEARMLSQL